MCIVTDFAAITGTSLSAQISRFISAQALREGGDNNNLNNCKQDWRRLCALKQTRELAAFGNTQDD